jgi:hypothetical protein
MFQLREELAIFLSETETPLTIYFSYVPWLQQLACLGDTLNKFKESAGQWRATAQPQFGGGQTGCCEVNPLTPTTYKDVAQ